ncbi:MAG: proline racemase family protein [Kordiimonas sp.]
MTNKVNGLTVTDMHTAGEPVRIITGGYPELIGNTILEKRQDALKHHDHLRKAMMLEPRGHSEMYGAIPVIPSDPSYDLGVLFTHGSGYSTMCGHATIAIGRWAIETGQIPKTEPVTEFTLECPCGPVQVATAVENGTIGNTSFESVTGYVHIEKLEVTLPSIGKVYVDIAYGGAYYAFISAHDLQLDFDKSSKDEIKTRAVELTDTIRSTYQIEHPEAADLGFLYGTIVTEHDEVMLDKTNRHLCYFAEGQLDRSPTGSGVTARLALAHHKGHVNIGDVCFFSGASGISFNGTITESSRLAGNNGVKTQVSGRAYHCGTSSYIIEDDDPLREGWQF